MFHFFLVALGAIIGGALRYWITLIPFNLFPNSQLFMVVWINISGSAIIGLLSSLSLSYEWTLFSIVGLLGSFTTFSSFTAGFFKLLDQSPSMALGYLLLSVIGSFLCFWLVRAITLKFLG